MNTKPHILIVDDDPVSRKAMELLLFEVAYDIFLAHNGMEAMDAIEKFHPDVIIVDVVMPDVDGYDLSRMLRRTRVGQGVPIILVSAFFETETKRSAFDGANAFLAKPIRKDELCELVSKMWDLRRLCLDLAYVDSTLAETIIPKMRAYLQKHQELQEFPS